MEDKVMKTRNSKLQKAGIETLSILAVLFATCFTLSAQGAKFESRIRHQEEFALNEAVKIAKTSSAKTEAAAEMALFAEFLTVENEAELKIESWMTDSGRFGSAFDLEAETEDVLKVEEWMIYEMLFKTTSQIDIHPEPTTVTTEKRPKAVGVTSMGNQFGRRAFILVEMDDPKLELESWMVDDKFWNRK
jgi:hypothetical protein